MKVKDVLNFELDKNRKSSLQIKAVKALVVFLILMFLFTVIARAADSITITKVTTTEASGMAISHSIETDGSVASVRDIAVTTVPNIRIEQVLAEESKTVEKGAELLVLNMEDVDKQIKAAQKEVDAANKAIEQAKKAKEAEKKAKEDAKKERAQARSRAQQDYNDTVKAAKKTLNRAKKERNAAKKAYENFKKKKNKKSKSSSSDSSVADTLKKTLDEKQEAYNKSVAELSGLEKDIEAEVQEAIKAAGSDLPQEQKQAIRDEITASDKNQKLLAQAQKKIDEMKDELDEAKAASDAYADEQALLSKQSYNERLKTLKNEYKEKKSAYSEAKSNYNQIVKDAKRTLNDALQSASDEDTSQEETEDEDTDEDDEDTLAEKQKALKAAQQLKEDGGKVKAPSDGLITKVNADVGDTTSEEALIRMSDKDSGFTFTGTLEKSSAKYLSKGDKVTITFSNGVNVQNLKIASIEVSSGDSSSYDIKVAIPAKVKKVTTFATLKVDKASKKYDTCVPLGCLHSDGSDYYVYTVSETKSVLGIETKVDKVSVNILDKNSEYAAIDGAFSYDQKYVLTSTKTLSDKDRVKIVKEDEPSGEDDEEDWED